MDEQLDVPVDGSVKCERCGAMFDTHDELQQHMGLAHAGEEVVAESAEGIQSGEDEL